MTSRRNARVAQAIRETVSTAILLELRDPRIQDVTVTRVEPSSDVRTAKIYVSIMGDAKKQQLCLHGLRSARGFLQNKIADRMQTRNTPVLQFVLDEGVKQSIEAAKIIRSVLGDASVSADDVDATPPDSDPTDPNTNDPDNNDPDNNDSDNNADQDDLQDSDTPIADDQG